jgi:hypothetical protein
VAGLFWTTFDRLAKRPLGFSAERVLTLETVTREPQPPSVWDQAVEQLRSVPGVEAVASSAWPLLKGWSTNGFVSVNGAAPGPVLAHFLPVSRGWMETMKMHLLEGTSEPAPGTAMVNQTFAKEYFPGQSPLGRSFARGKLTYRISGVVNDAPYRSLREPILPVAFLPMERPSREMAFIVRTTGANPSALAGPLRRELAKRNFRVSNVRTQQELIDSKTLRERLLAWLGLFFASVAVVLAGVGLYGVLNYLVLQRRREIGIRLAIGAKFMEIARLVSTQALLMVLAGIVGGWGMGRAASYYLESLLYEVKPTDLTMMTLPAIATLACALLAASIPVLRAARIDPVSMLRAE